MHRVKIMLAASFAAAVIFWGLSASLPWVALLRGPGRPAVIVAAAVASHITWLVLLLHLRREKRTDDRLRQLEGEYRRREAALVKTIQRLASGPATGPLPRLYPVASGESRRARR